MLKDEERVRLNTFTSTYNLLIDADSERLESTGHERVQTNASFNLSFISLLVRNSEVWNQKARAPKMMPPAVSIWVQTGPQFPKAQNMFE